MSGSRLSFFTKHEEKHEESDDDTNTIKYGFSQLNNQLIVFFAHGSVLKYKIPMMYADVKKIQGNIKSRDEASIFEEIVRAIKEEVTGKDIDQIIYVGDINIGESSGPPRKFLLNGELEESINKGDKKFEIFKILYSSSKDIIENAQKYYPDNNTKVILNTQLKGKGGALKQIPDGAGAEEQSVRRGPSK
jgi:hypothetical protein